MTDPTDNSRAGSQPPPGGKPSGLSGGRAYQGALEAVLAIVIMVVLGAWADARFGTKPVLLLVGLAIGFGSFVLRLIRLLRELEPPVGEDTKDRATQDRVRSDG